MKRRPMIAAILNITPDSFSGDGILNPKNIEQAIHNYIEQGADIIDIGAESTAPGSPEITLEEEQKRLASVFEIVKKLKSKEVVFSIDTMNASTARKAIDAGFVMVNDVSGGRKDPNMFQLIAGTGVQYVLMYCKNSSGHADVYDDQENVYKKIIQFFDQQMSSMKKAGILQKQIILDPGMGSFISAKAEDSLYVLDHIQELNQRYSLPVYIGASRKGFLKKIPQFAQAENPSIAAALYAAKNGADYLRVHDTKETIDGLQESNYT